MDFVGLLRQGKLLLNENSTAILTSMGVAGTVSTAYLSARASFKAAEILHRPENQEELTPHEGTERPDGIREWDSAPLTKPAKFKLVWYLYLPPVATGTVTIAAIVFAHRIDTKKIAALTVASGISERALQEYKAKVIEKLGERQSTKIRDEIAQDQVTAHPPRPGEIVVVGAGEVLCFDQLTGRYFHSTVEEIRKAENKLNHDILHYDGASLAEFHNMIGLDSTPYTSAIGWNPDHLIEVQFSSTMTPDEKPCLVLGFNYPPTPAYTQMR